MEEGDLLLSYSNNFWSIGNVYQKAGFSFVSCTSPNYWWTNSKEELSRYKCQKHKLIKIYGSELVESERQFMEEHLKMHWFFDAGNLIWEYRKGGK